MKFFNLIALRATKTLWSLTILSAVGFNTITLRTAKTSWSHGHSECSRVNRMCRLTGHSNFSLLLLTFTIQMMCMSAFFHSSVHSRCICTRGYQKVLSLTWKEPEIWIYSALFFNVVPFQLHTLVPSSYPVINTRSVEVNILVP